MRASTPAAGTPKTSMSHEYVLNSPNGMVSPRQERAASARPVQTMQPAHQRPASSAVYGKNTPRSQQSHQQRPMYSASPSRANQRGTTVARTSGFDQMQQPQAQAQGLVWSVTSMLSFFPLLDFATVNQAMSSVLPNFVAVGSSTHSPVKTRNPTHEQVQQVLAKLSDLTEKRQRMLEHKSRIEERQTERRWQLFYERPQTKSERLMNFPAERQTATMSMIFPPPQQQQSPHLLHHHQPPHIIISPSASPIPPVSPASATTTSEVVRPSSSSSSLRASGHSPSNAPSANPSGAAVATHAAGTAPSHRSILSISNVSASKLRPPGVDRAGSRLSSRRSISQNLTPLFSAHGLNTFGRNPSVLNPVATVAASVFNLDFLAPVPPRNGVAEWLTSTPTPPEQQQQEGEPMSPSAAATAQPFSPRTQPPTPAIVSPRFNRHAKLLAISPERRANTASHEVTAASALAPTLTADQEASLRSFLLSIECPFFRTSLRGFSVSSVLNSHDLHLLAWTVLAPKYTASHEIVPALFSVMNDLAEVNSILAAEDGVTRQEAAATRSYDSWVEFISSLRCVFQLGREVYIETVRTLLGMREEFGRATGFQMSDTHVLYLLERGVLEKLPHAPKHLIAILTGFMSPASSTMQPSSSTSSGGSVSAASNRLPSSSRRFTCFSSLLTAVRSHLASTPQARAAIFNTALLPPGTDAEMMRKMDEVLDQYVLGGATMKRAIDAAVQASKRRTLAQTMAAEEELAGTTATANSTSSGLVYSPTNQSPASRRNGSAAGRVRAGLTSASPHKTVVANLSLTSSRETFLALLVSLHSSPSVAASTLLAQGDLDTMMTPSAHGHLLDMTPRALQAFTTRLDAETRLEAQALASAAYDTADMAQVLGLLTREHIWAGKKHLEQRHFDQLVRTVPPTCGGVRMLKYVLTRDDFMRNDAAAAGSSTPGSPVTSRTGSLNGSDSGSSSSATMLSPYQKFKPLLRLVRQRVQSVLSDAKKVHAYLDSRGAPWKTLFESKQQQPPQQQRQPKSERGGFPPPQLTLSDAVHLILDADCASSGDALMHLRSLVCFARSFASPDLPASDVLSSLGHATRANAMAQQARLRIDASDIAYELELFFAPTSAGGGGGQKLFVASAGFQQVDGHTIRQWLRSIAAHVPLTTTKMVGAPRSQLSTLLLILHHFLTRGLRFEDANALSWNIDAVAQQLPCLKREVGRTLYHLALQYSSVDGGSESSLLRALRQYPSTVEKIFDEGFCGAHAVAALQALQEASHAAVKQEARQPDAAAEEESSAMPLCTWQSVEEVIACLQAYSRHIEAHRIDLDPSGATSLLPLLETHLNVTAWSRTEFISTLANLNAASHPFLHASVAAALNVASLEALYEKLACFLSTEQMVHLPEVLWTLAENLTCTIPTAAISGSSTPTSGQRKFHGLEQFAAAILEICTLNSRSEVARARALVTPLQDFTLQTPSTMELLGAVETYLLANQRSLFTPECIASSAFKLNKTHAAQACAAIQREILTNDVPSDGAGGGLSSQEVVQRMSSLVLEQGLFPDWSSFTEALASYAYKSPAEIAIYTFLRDPSTSTPPSSRVSVILSNGSNYSSTAAGSASRRLLDATEQQALTVRDVQLLLYETDCVSRPHELLSLLQDLNSAVAASSSSGANEAPAMFDAFHDSLVPAVRTIIAVNRAKRVEQELVRAHVQKQVANQSRASNLSPKQEVEAAERDAVAQLSAAIVRAASELFHSPQSWMESATADDDYADDDADVDSMAQPPVEMMQRLLHAVGSSSPALACATALYFLAYLQQDYSCSAVSARSAALCADLEELECIFVQLKWRKEWIVRQLVTAVLEKEQSQRGATATAAAALEHDWTLLYQLFTGTASGFSSLSLLPTLRTVLPDYSTLPSFIDGLRLLHSQSSDAMHEPILTQLWNIIQADRSPVKLIDATKFETSVVSMKSLFPAGLVSAHALPDIEAQLDLLASRSPAYTTWCALLRDFRAALYAEPFELVRDVLDAVAPESEAMIWRWNTERREKEFWGLEVEQRDPESTPAMALNYLTLRPQITAFGPSIRACIDRCLAEGISFTSVEDMLEYMRTMDLITPLASNAGWRARLLSQQPPVDSNAAFSPAVPSSESTSPSKFGRLGGARHQQSVQAIAQAALASAALAHEAELAAQLEARSVELKSNFDAERAQREAEMLAAKEQALAAADEASRAQAEEALRAAQAESDARLRAQREEANDLLKSAQDAQASSFQRERESFAREREEQERKFEEVSNKLLQFELAAAVTASQQQHSTPSAASRRATYDKQPSVASPSPSSPYVPQSNVAGRIALPGFSRVSSVAARTTLPESKRASVEAPYTMFSPHQESPRAGKRVTMESPATSLAVAVFDTKRSSMELSRQIELPSSNVTSKRSSMEHASAPTPTMTASNANDDEAERPATLPSSSDAITSITNPNEQADDDRK